MSVAHVIESGGADRRPEVDFLCVGGMRCGSTSLWSILRTHPSVFLPDTKELHFFDREAAHTEADIDAYRGHFVAARPDQVRGEFTPSYLTRDGVAERIAAHLPSARILAVLRDPVARAWSHYWFRVRQGREGMSFDAAVDAEDARAREPEGWRFAYLAWGCYAAHLRRFTGLFGPDRVLVVFLEDLAADAAQEVGRIGRFLEIDAKGIGATPTLRRMNEMVVPRIRPLYTICKRTEVRLRGRTGLAHAVRRCAVRLAEANQRTGAHEMSARTERRLRDRLAGPDAELRALLGRSLPWDPPADAAGPESRGAAAPEEVKR